MCLTIFFGSFSSICNCKFTVHYFESCSILFFNLVMVVT
uniref:Uncharacterized protein n=1 Tax=Arundo donax TaxID=35708 RepID=A0A0A9FIF7_ARUDO